MTNKPKCPECGRQMAKIVNTTENWMTNKPVANCKICGNLLYQMHTISGEFLASHCLNRKCRNYGNPQYFKTGLREKDIRY